MTSKSSAVSVPLVQDLYDWNDAGEVLSKMLGELTRKPNAVGAEDAPETSMETFESLFGDEDSGPSLVVLPSIGDPFSEEGENVARRYAALMQPLPLNVCRLSGDSLFDALNGEFPWLEQATEELASAADLCEVGGAPFYCPPLLLDGPPGIGKTRWARRAAELAGLGWDWTSLAGVHTSVGIQGMERAWKGSRPGFAADALVGAKSANPILLVDEIDKAVGSHHGNPVLALMPFLEQETSSHFKDDFFLAPMDLSRIIWIMTANDARLLPDAFRTRAELIRCDRPSEAQVAAMVPTMVVEICNVYGVPAGALPSPDPQKLARIHAMGGSLRAVKRAVAREMASAARSGRATGTGRRRADRCKTRFRLSEWKQDTDGRRPT